MKYVITRASMSFSEMTKKPCDEAIPTVIEKEWGVEVEWTVELNTLESLMAFVNKYRSIILSGSSIKIYDSYVE